MNDAELNDLLNSIQRTHNQFSSGLMLISEYKIAMTQKVSLLPEIKAGEVDPVCGLRIPSLTDEVVIASMQNEESQEYFERFIG